MEFFLNSRSLHNQFDSVETFKTALRTIFSHRSTIEQFEHRLSVRRDITSRLVHSNLTFQVAISKISDLSLKRSILNWLDKTGPFWDINSQKHSPEDFFWFEDDIVTDDVLAEAAFRISNDEDTATISFAPSHFQINPIPIIFQKPTTSEVINIPNFWDKVTLTEKLEDLMPTPDSWSGCVKRWGTKFKHLMLLDSIDEALDGHPFNNAIASQVETLLAVLQKYQLEMFEDGSLSARGRELAQNYFEREAAKFTDESETNKIKFRRELTFRLPDGSEIFCPFHGKISTGFYRIHHSWPPKFGQRLVVAYIGPKITKS